ncbi:nicotinate-nucleotide--dimethylbenzimidazole phosphoribosyltransferase [Streptomyces sp. NPDC101733]|uniref:nicotinate-nucleotide--dimethylbenzimidazole phosphoribosyltransferase n=1 Tax=unclassified Streptomyces TaxID=2593676 RepID=UPI003825E827
MTDTGQVPGEGHPDNGGMVDQQGIPAPLPPLPPMPPQPPVGYAFQDLVDDPVEAEDEELLLMPSGQGSWSDPQVVPQAPVFASEFPAEPVYTDYSQAAPAPGAGYPAPGRLGFPEAGHPEAGYPETGYSVPAQAAPGFPEAVHPEGSYADPSAAAAPLGYAEPAAYSAGAHEAGGRDTGALDLGGLLSAPAPVAPQAPAAPVTPSRRPLHMGPPVPDATGGVVRSLADRGPAAAPTAPVAPVAPLNPAAPLAPVAAPEAQPQPEPVVVLAAAVAAPEQPQAEQARPAPAPVAPGPPAPLAAGPEYLDAPQAVAPEVAAPAAPQLAEVPPQGGAPWTVEAPEPVAAPEPVPAPDAVAPQAPVEAVAPEAQPETQPEPVVVPEAPEAAQEPAAAPEEAPQAPAAEAPVAAEPTAEESAEPQSEPEAQSDPEPLPEAPQAVVPAPAETVVQAPVEAVAPEARPEPRPEPVSVPEPLLVLVPDLIEAPEAAQEPAAAPEEAPEVVPGAPAAEVVEAVEAVEIAELPEPAPVSAGEAAPGYADAEREAVLRVMRERRDIRKGFRSDPIPHEVLLRVLEAAHTAPSVGHSQPWDFVVIKSAETRRTMHQLAERQREAYAKSLPKGRAKQFKELKIEAILDTPVNIVVTADPTRGGRHTLGRHTQPQMAPYSSALAVENLWLAARAEGLGVGWVSFFDEREMVRSLGLPEHLEVVAYLCVGYVDEFPDEPELAQAGWSQRRPLAWVVHEETYGRRALPGEAPHDLLSETVAGIRPLDAKALGEAWERQKRMTKPAGALGMLEIISAQLAGLSRVCPPPIPEPAAVAIFAGDHGVHAQGVTPWPQEVTLQMVANFLGGGAVCNAFANQVGAEVCVIDVGVAGDLPATPGLLPRKVRPGTADMSTGPAMTREEAIAAIEVGIETARDLVAAGNKALLTGEMGIANTTVSAALISVFTGVDPAEVTGRGTGINDETHARKVEVVRRALELHQPDPADPIGVLAAIGGLEHAAIVGLLLGGASLRTPVILDGVSAGAAALVARAIAPESLSACIAGHRSAEPGHVAALNKLGLRPLVDLDLRLGEGTGALLALPLVQSAARAMHEVATFDSAGVTEK